MGSDTVAIGLITYNDELFLSEAIDSLINQSYPDFKMIILDDSSTDRTWQILSEYAAKDSRISVFRNAQNRGYSSNCRRTFQLAGSATNSSLSPW